MMTMAFLGLLFLPDLKKRMILQRGNQNLIIFRNTIILGKIFCGNATEHFSCTLQIQVIEIFSLVYAEVIWECPFHTFIEQVSL